MLRPVMLMPHAPATRRAAGAIAALVLALAFVPAALAGPGVPVDAATPTQRKEAQALYEKGAKAFEAKKYDEAVLAFQASYDVVLSPNAHMMLARSLIETGQHARAYDELGIAETEAAGHDRYAVTLEKVRALREETKAKIAIVRVIVKGVSSTEGLTARLGAETLPLGLPRAMAPGKVTVDVLQNGAVLKTAEADLLPGGEQTVEVDLTPPPPPPLKLPPPPPPPPPKSGPPLGYIVSGAVVGVVGLAGIGTGTALYLMAKSDHDELEAVCGSDGSCPAERAGQIQDGRDKQAWGVITWVVGGAATGLGVGLLLAGAFKGDPKSDDVSFDVGPGYLGVTTRF